MNIFGYGGIRKCTHGCHGNSLQNGCHGSTNNVAIRHFRASNVAILELMATTYLHKNGCHDHISPCVNPLDNWKIPVLPYI